MANTYLREDDRRAIADAVSAHKYDIVDARLREEEGQIADRLYGAIYNQAARTMMMGAPDGAFGLNNSLQLLVDGKRLTVKFQEGCQRPVFWKHRNDPVINVREGQVPAADAALGLKNRMKAADEARRDIRSMALATISKFRSFEKLAEAWPEAETFIWARLRERGNPSAGVPAVLFMDLNKALELPPEDKAAAA